jgi:DNA-binding NarL/FixJ family response regulator
LGNNVPVQDGTNCGQGAWNSLNIRAYIIDFPVGRVVEGRNENRPQIVIFSSLSEDNVRYLALHSAIPGFVHKIDIKEAFHLAIETVCCGGAFFSPTARRIRAGTRLSFESYGNVLSVQAEEVR